MSLSHLPDEILPLILELIIPKFIMGAFRNASTLTDYIIVPDELMHASTFLSIFQTLKLVSRPFYHATWLTVRHKFDRRMRLHELREDIAAELADLHSFNKIGWLWPWVKELNIRCDYYCQYLSQMNVERLSNLKKVTVNCTDTFQKTGFTLGGTPHHQIIEFVKTNTEMQDISSTLETFRNKGCKIFYGFSFPLPPGRPFEWNPIRPGMVLDVSSLEDVFVVELYEDIRASNESHRGWKYTDTYETRRVEIINPYR